MSLCPSKRNEFQLRVCALEKFGDLERGILLPQCMGSWVFGAESLFITRIYIRVTLNYNRLSAYLAVAEVM